MSQSMILWLVSTLLLVPNVASQRYDGQYWPCNPMQNASCPPNPGLNQYDYFIDFTNPPSDLAEDWSTSNYATITYNTKGKNGAEFTFAKRYDAPQLFTNFYIFFGRVDVVMQVSPGIAMISSAVLMSDDFDEIDWEMSGNDFNMAKQYPTGVVQNNYFSKGITGYYDRGMFLACTRPQTQFHTYSFDWTPERLQWLIDGQVVRTFLASNADNKDHQYPQTPSKLQLGIWSGGDPDQNDGTRNWAGGYTDLKAVPYTMFVKSVRIKNYNPARHYKWSDQSGSWKSIKLINDTVSSSSSSSSQSSTKSTSSTASLATPSLTSLKSVSSTSSSTSSKSSTTQAASSTTSTAKIVSSTSSTSSSKTTTTSPATTSVLQSPTSPKTSIISTSSTNTSPSLLTTSSIVKVSSSSATTAMATFGDTFRSTLSTSIRTSSTQTSAPTASRGAQPTALNPTTSSVQTAIGSTITPATNPSSASSGGGVALNPAVNPFETDVDPTETLVSTTASTALSPPAATSAAEPSRELVTAPLWPFRPSQNGLCAYRAFRVCKNSNFGQCCSRWGYCGETEAYCGGNCLKRWGSCWKETDDDKKKAVKRGDFQPGRRDRAYPPGKRPNATDIV